MFWAVCLGVPALANSDNVADRHADEGGGAVGRQVAVSLLVAVVLLDIVQVITADDNGAIHLGRDNGAGQDAPTDGDVASPGALLVDVGAGDGLLGGLEAQTNILEPAGTSTLGDNALVVLEDGLLLLERAVGLARKMMISI